MSQIISDGAGQSAQPVVSAESADDKPERKTQATILVELASGLELFHTPEGEPFNWPLRSTGFRDWLTRRFYEAEGATSGAFAAVRSSN